MSGYMSETSTYSRRGISGSHVARQAGSVTGLKCDLLPRPSVSVTPALSTPAPAFRVALPRGHAAPSESCARGHVKLPRGREWKTQVPFGKGGLLAWCALGRAGKIVIKLYGP